MTTYIKAHYPQSEMFETFSGTDKEVYKAIIAELNDPENFTYSYSSDPIDDYQPCNMDDLKQWADTHGMTGKQNAKKERVLDATLVLRCTKSEKAIWTDFAKRKGMNLAGFTRAAINSYRKA